MRSWGVGDSDRAKVVEMAVLQANRDHVARSGLAYQQKWNILDYIQEAQENVQQI